MGGPKAGMNTHTYSQVTKPLLKENSWIFLSLKAVDLEYFLNTASNVYLDGGMLGNQTPQSRSVHVPGTESCPADTQ